MATGTFTQNSQHTKTLKILKKLTEKINDFKPAIHTVVSSGIHFQKIYTYGFLHADWLVLDSQGVVKICTNMSLSFLVQSSSI